MSGPSKSGRTLRLWVGLAIMAAGAVFQIPSCQGVLTTFNPCGSIFAFCNARDIDALFGSVPDFNLDPTCTIPFFGVDNPGQAGGCSTVEVFPVTPGPRP